MADEKSNKIWIESKRLNVGGVKLDLNFREKSLLLSDKTEKWDLNREKWEQNETSTVSSVECIEVRPESQRKDVLNQIKEEFDIDVDDEVLKLRNHRGSLIPINGNVPVNSKSMPYILEITSRHQNVIPKPKSVKLLSYDETVKKKIQDIIARIDRLEVAALQLTVRRNNRIEKQEMKELDGMLEFLNKRLTEANGTKWKGMFKKNPLW